MGHAYFTLKDSDSCVRCVLFKFDLQKLSFSPVNGSQVVVTASPTIYSPKGDFQLRVSDINRAGTGKFLENFLHLKRKLTLEGLFDSNNKLEIPNFFNCVGIVTSIDSAALRDVIITFQNKLGRVKLKIFPSMVQGASAALDLTLALNKASLDSEVEIIILARGGGSLEDLWTFNDEGLVRTVSKITKPIITGIGHESDTTLSDLVADYRAAPPTAAVERLVVEEEILISKLDKNNTILARLIKSLFDKLEQKLDFLSLKVKSPRDKVTLNENKFLNMHQRLGNTKANMFKGLFLDLQYYKNKIRILDPLSILKRGFCIIYEKNSENVVSSINQINKGKNLDVQLFDGNARVKVNEINKNSDF
jgi:exodeoxyribonuclease VII large subunit